MFALAEITNNEGLFFCLLSMGLGLFGFFWSGGISIQWKDKKQYKNKFDKGGK